MILEPLPRGDGHGSRIAPRARLFAPPFDRRRQCPPGSKLERDRSAVARAQPLGSRLLPALHDARHGEIPAVAMTHCVDGPARPRRRDEVLRRRSAAAMVRHDHDVDGCRMRPRAPCSRSASASMSPVMSTVCPPALTQQHARTVVVALVADVAGVQPAEPDAIPGPGLATPAGVPGRRAHARSSNASPAGSAPASAACASMSASTLPAPPL